MSYVFFSAPFLHHVVLQKPLISFNLGPPATPPEFKNSSHPDGKEPMLVKGPISWSWSGHLQQRIKVASGIWRLQAGGNMDVLPYISTRCLIPHENWYVQCSASSTSCTEQLWDLKLWNEALQNNGDRWRPSAYVMHARFVTMNFCDIHFLLRISWNAMFKHDQMKKLRNPNSYLFCPTLFPTGCPPSPRITPEL